MRIFLGIEFNKEVKARILERQKVFKEAGNNGKWERIDNFHLTLLFIGETPDEKVEELKEQLGLLIKDLGPIALAIKDTGIFGSMDDIRVLWLGLQGELEKLYQLRRILEQGCQNIALDYDKKPLKPHITIGRNIKLSKDFEKLLQHHGEKEDMIAFEAKSISIIKSEAIGNRRVYRPVISYVL